METDPQRIQYLAQEHIAVVPYSPRWPEIFLAEVASLRAILPARLVLRIEHIGSTAVPGLAAKPIIDVLVGVTDLAEARRVIVPLLAAQGYEYLWRPTHGDDGPPWYAWFIKRDPTTGARTHHVHMVETGPAFAEHWERLLFRDYLIAHPDVAQQYGDLKQRLAATYPRDRAAYTRAKSDFIMRAMAAVRTIAMPEP